MNLSFTLRLAVSAVLTAVILRLNPYAFSQSVGYPVASIARATIIALLSVDVVCLVGIVLIAFRWDLVTQAARIARTVVLSGERHLHITAALPCAALSYVYFCVVASFIGAKLASPITLISLLWPALASGVFLSAALRRGRGRLTSAWTIAALFYIALAIANLLSLQNGGGQFSWRMLGWVSKESLCLFLRPSVLIAPAIAVLAFWLVAFWHDRFHHPSSREAWIAIAAGLAMTTVNLSAYAAGMASIFQSAERRLTTRIEIAALSHIAGPIQLTAYHIRKIAKAEKVAVDPEIYAEGLRRWCGHTQGPGAPNPGPPKRIIVLFVESLSLNFSKAYNPQLPATLTPHLDALPQVDVQKLRIRTISSPTTPGLATHFCSLPNADLANDVGYQCSVVSRLKEAGWRTVIFESAPEDFDDGRRRFAQIGFSELYGAHYQEKHGLGEFIKQWGVCDRKTLSSIVDYVAAHRDEKLFIAGLTIDTHLPVGRTKYGSMTYPDAPSWIVPDRAALLLRSVYRFDHDVNDFIEELRKIDSLEDTVIVVTADHSLPPFPELDDRLGLAHSRFEEIPFFMIGKKAPPAFPSPTDSQLDTAPTIAWLAGVDGDPRWWGRSLFQPAGGVMPLYQFDHGRGLAFNPKTGAFDTPVRSEVQRLLECYPVGANSQATRETR